MTIDLPLTAYQITLVQDRLEISIQISEMDADYFGPDHLRDLQDLQETIQRRDPIPPWGAHLLHEMATSAIADLERQPTRSRSDASDLISWRNLQDKIVRSGYLSTY